MDLARPIAVRDRVEPVGSGEFAGFMEAFAPFESAPHLAVAVSGGSDSMALVLLAADWARARDGRVTAVTVDHGLRPEAAEEAARVAGWCAARGITHEILHWTGPAPRSGIQAAARAARYRLLEDWCSAHDVLHLLVAHQREDQAETLLMRLLRNSGIDGLAGMAAVVERGAIRVLRPLLTLPRARLRATLAAAGQNWIEDPSNRDLAYLRVRLRTQREDFAAHGFTVERLADLADRFGRARAVLENERAELLARAVMLHPAGFAWLDRAAILAASEELGRKALAAVITAVSGAEYPPRRERLERLFQGVQQGLGGGRSLGGCLILPRRGKILICREPAAAAAPVPAIAGGRTRWDGRFSLDLDPGAATDLTLGGLAEDVAAIRHDVPAAAWEAVPAAARATLPALRDARGVVAVPPLRYVCDRRPEAVAIGYRLRFRPTRPLAAARFRIV